MHKPNDVHTKKRYKRKPIFSKVETTRKAKDVLYEKMIFWHTKGAKLLKSIEEEIRLKGKSDAKLLLGAMKMLKDADDLAIHCAEKLAPYQDAKLQSVEVKQKIEHRFVIRAPAQMQDASKWLEQTGQAKEIAEVVLEKIEAPSRVNIDDFSDYDEIEDQRNSLN